MTIEEMLAEWSKYVYRKPVGKAVAWDDAKVILGCKIALAEMLQDLITSDPSLDLDRVMSPAEFSGTTETGSEILQKYRAELWSDDQYIPMTIYPVTANSLVANLTFVTADNRIDIEEAEFGLSDGVAVTHTCSFDSPPPAV